MLASEMGTVPQQRSLSPMDPHEHVKINAGVLSIMKGETPDAMERISGRYYEFRV